MIFLGSRRKQDLAKSPLWRSVLAKSIRQAIGVRMPHQVHESAVGGTVVKKDVVYSSFWPTDSVSNLGIPRMINRQGLKASYGLNLN